MKRATVSVMKDENGGSYDNAINQARSNQHCTQVRQHATPNGQHIRQRQQIIIGDHSYILCFSKS